MVKFLSLGPSFGDVTMIADFANLKPQPLLPGDVLVSLTDIFDETNERGNGRVLQYTNDFKLKGALMTGKVGLTTGLAFAPDGTLFAMDQHARAVTRFDRQGTKLPDIAFGDKKPFGCVVFAKDGSVLMGEHFIGRASEYWYGDGDLYRFTQDGKQLALWDVETDGGIANFLGLTHMTLASDGRTLAYVSETGPRIMRFDIAEGKQLPDLVNFKDQEPRRMFFAVKYLPDDTLLVGVGNGAQRLDKSGAVIQEYKMPHGRGWSVISVAPGGRKFYFGDFFSGEFARLDVASGAVETIIATEKKKCLAGVIEVPPVAA